MKKSKQNKECLKSGANENGLSRNQTSQNLFSKDFYIING